MILFDWRKAATGAADDTAAISYNLAYGIADIPWGHVPGALVYVSACTGRILLNIM